MARQQQPTEAVLAPAAATPQATQPTLHIPPIPVNLTVTVGTPTPPTQLPVQPPPAATPAAPVPAQPPTQQARTAGRPDLLAQIRGLVMPRGRFSLPGAITAGVIGLILVILTLVALGVPGGIVTAFRKPHYDPNGQQELVVNFSGNGLCVSSPNQPTKMTHVLRKDLVPVAIQQSTLEQEHRHDMDSIDQVQEDTAEGHRHTETMSAIDAGLGKVVFYNTTADQSGDDPVTITGSFGTVQLTGGEFKELMLLPGKYRTQIRYASYPQFSGPYDFEVVGVVPRQKAAPDGTQFKCVSLGWL